MMEAMQNEPARAPDEPAFLRGGGHPGRRIRAVRAPVPFDIGLPGMNGMNGMNGNKVCPPAGMAARTR